MKPSDYTPEQLENVLRYGACPICNTPRERFVERAVDERPIKIGLTAPCGHGIDPRDPFSILTKSDRTDSEAKP